MVVERSRYRSGNLVDSDQRISEFRFSATLGREPEWKVNSASVTLR